MSADNRLAEIRARADNATPGPWHGDHDEFGCVHIGDYGWVASGPQGQSPEYDVDTMQGRTDAEFIAHARTDVPWLLAEIERLRRGRNIWREHAIRAETTLARVRELSWEMSPADGPRIRAITDPDEHPSDATIDRLRAALTEETK